MIATTLLVAVSCGYLFSTGWCILIDGIRAAPSEGSGRFLWYYLIPAFLTSISAIFINFMDAEQLRAASSRSAFSDDNVTQVRFYFYSMLTLGLCGIFGACWILIADYPANASGQGPWPGIAILLQTLSVMIAGLVFFFLGQIKPSLGF
jgi:Uncharacterised protein family (UPF0220)